MTFIHEIFECLLHAQLKMGGDLRRGIRSILLFYGFGVGTQVITLSSTHKHNNRRNLRTSVHCSAWNTRELRSFSSSRLITICVIFSSPLLLVTNLFSMAILIHSKRASLHADLSDCYNSVTHWQAEWTLCFRLIGLFNKRARI